MPKQQPSLRKELFLILFGAVVSAISITGTTLFNNRLESQRALDRSKMEFTKDLAETTGKRLFISFSLYRANRDSTSELSEWTNKYFESIEDWNAKSAFYFGLLEHHFGKQKRIEFLNKVYEPLLEFGIKANSKSFNEEERTEMNRIYSEINSSTISFISDLFN